jgi:hypothetical protein
MKTFWRNNQVLLIVFGTLISFIFAALLTSFTLFSPLSSRQIEVDPSNKIDSELWIIAKERYGVSLWIGKPKELDQATFDRLTGCPDVNRISSGRFVPGVTIPFRWEIQSSDERIVAQSSAQSITPRGNGCSTTAGGHLIGLGGFLIDPGTYHFKFEFSSDIPGLKDFPAKVFARCCGQGGTTWLSPVITFTNFLVVPLSLLCAVVLALVLLVRAGMAVFAARSVHTPTQVNHL